MSELTLPKCANCSQPIEVRDAVVTIGLERLHVTCWHVLISLESMRASRKMARRSRQTMTRVRIERACTSGSDRSA